MAKKGKKKGTKKKEGKRDSAGKEENAAIKKATTPQSPTVQNNDETQEEVSDVRVSCTVQTTKGKFKTSRQRKRANIEQQLREEKSSTSKKKGITEKVQAQQATGFETKEMLIENRGEQQHDNPEVTKDDARSLDNGAAANSNSDDMYNLRPSYIQKKESKESNDSEEWRKVARNRQKSVPAISSNLRSERHSSSDHDIFNRRPSYNSTKDREKAYNSSNWRQTNTTANPSSFFNNRTTGSLWRSNSHQQDEEEPRNFGDWRNVTRQPHKFTASSYSQSESFDLSTIINLWPLDIQRILEKKIHNIITGENTPNKFDLLRALAQACAAGKTDSLSTILTALKCSDFLRNQIPEMLREIQKGSQGSEKEPEKRQAILDMLILYQAYLRCLPSAYSDLPLDKIQRYFREMTVPGKTELQDKLNALKNERDEIIQRRRNPKPFKVNPDTIIPNNFRELQIFPTVHELTSDELPFLRANVKKGSYQDAEHYLDVQFRLYREDFITPLRDGIQEIVKKIPKNERGQNIKTYEKVHLKEKKYTRNGIIYRLQFDVSKFRRTRWESSKRLVYGSFLCLSKDNFENTLFATVANSDPQELARGLLDVSFIEGQNIYGIEQRENDQYVMAESPAYFEAYRHVLVALQNMREGSLPFQKYLVECNREVDAPAYLRDKEEVVRYDLSNALDVQHVKEAKDVPLLEPEEWPDVSQLPLNDSQYEALRTALTKEFSVIQGPPGTGKTYVGLKIARCLLDNSHAWNPKQDSPILMVCFTNHALDQFLEGILDFLPKGIIRVGSRCKSERLEKCNLKNDVNIGFEQRFDTKRRLEKQLRRIEAKKLALERFESKNVIKKIQDLEDGNCISKEHLDSFYYSHLYDGECKTLQDVFEAWICNKSNRRRHVDCSEMTPVFKAEYQVPSQQKVGVEALEYDVNEYSELDDEGDWGIADTDIEFPEPENFVKGNSDNVTDSDDSEDNWEDAYSEHPCRDYSGDEFFECDMSLESDHATDSRSDTVNPQSFNVKDGIQDDAHEWIKKKKKTKDMQSTSEVIVKNEKEQEGGVVETNASDTIDISQEFETSRHLDGEEDLYQPICTTIDLSDNDEGKYDETSTGNKINDWQTDTQFIKISVNASTLNESSGRKGAKKRKKKKKSKNTSNKETPSNIEEAITKLKDLNKMTQEEIETISSIWNIGHVNRLRLYLTWVNLLKEDFKRKIIQEEAAYEGLCREVESARIVEEEKILRKAKVIGMTTTGAARYHAVLQRIKPRIVIIEEAAEVLEAHIITSLAKDTEQVILIGDHKQLRPKPTVHELAIKYNLEISLFERMVLNKMDCKMLSIQHRMRPEIAQLTKRIYKDDIYDDISVTNFEDVRGLKTNLFFIDHREEEAFHNGLQSYANYHEADMMVAMCRYLLQQDYEPNQITILTLYIGQLLALKDKMPREEFDGVRVSVVDNYQGEENDIILLSLVRSNVIGSTGFLKESNRVCVALSRARKGLYCIGNFGLLSKERLWKEICDDLKTKGAIADSIKLACTNHGNVTVVKKVDDFKKVPSGGCALPCDLRLPCGHLCPERCHGNDPEHKDKKKCSKICLTLCPQELHRCRKRCHFPDNCASCPFPVTKVFSECGHECKMPCGTDPKTQNCEYIEYKTLQCGHQKDVPCFLDPLQSLLSQFEQTKKNIRDFSKLFCSPQKSNDERVKCLPDLRNIKGNDFHNELNDCITKFAKHKDRLLKIQKHWPAYENALHCQENCISVCKRGLHSCSQECHYGKECGPCKVKVKVKIQKCGHSAQVSCYKNFETTVCKEMCARLLKCGHPCKEKCKVDCSSYKCKMLCMKLCKNQHPCKENCHLGKPCNKCTVETEKHFPNCNHKTTVKCHVDVSTVPCFMPCEKRRQCGHPCDQHCHQACESFQCNKKVLKTLPCGHQTRLPCYLAPSQYPCTSLVIKALPCDHKIQVPCNSDLYKHTCMEEVMKKLPCGHESKMKCHSDPSKRICKEQVTRKLSCGHESKMQCHADPLKRQCSIMVMKKLSCSHEMEMECHFDPSKRKCREQVTKKLSCGHEFEMKCHSDPLKQICTKPTSKKLPCGHEIQVSCNANIRQRMCKLPVSKELSCGHTIKMLCNEDPSQHACQKLVLKKMKCGHQIEMPCSLQAMKRTCTANVERALPCGHLAYVPCNKVDMSNYKCTENVSSKLECGHEIQVPCNTKFAKYVCKKQVMKKLPCGHENQMPCNVDPSNHICTTVVDYELQCGHVIKRACRLSKSMPIDNCSEQVTKKLSCGHKHQMKCHLDPTQYICTKQVEKKLSCDHNKFMPCHEDISRATCTEQVVKKLPCGHENKMPCNFDVNNFHCLTLVKIEPTCGHLKEVPCSTSLDVVVCDEMIEKKLPCHHSKIIPCYKETNSVLCEEFVQKELSCKHLKKVRCHEKNVDSKCYEEVTKTLLCKHEKRLPCYINTESPEVKCNKTVTKRLACGHEVDSPCNIDVKTISCIELTKKQLPCNHEVETPCNAEVKTISCIKLTKKQLPCSHEVEVHCNVDVKTISCTELTKKQLPCSHEVEVPCKVDVTRISCDMPTTKKLPCSHEVDVPCNKNVSTISCDKLVMKQLPCSHGAVQLACNIDINTIPCIKPVVKQLPCSHTKEVPCNMDVATVLCKQPTIKHLSCSHTIELPCNEDQKQYICQRPCERSLPCSHRCKQKCYEMCDPKLCTEFTKKTVPCPNKHKITVPCDMNIPDTFVCNEKTTKDLNCGHLWQEECSRSALPFRCEIKVSRTLGCPGKHKRDLPCYVDVSKIPCGEQCSKTLPCGHACKLYCDEPCDPNKCNERVLKTFEPCGHTRRMPCGKSAEATCLYRCLRPLPDCKHRCQGSCGKPCNKPCLYKVRKKLPCGHRLKMNCCDPVEYVRCPSACNVKLDCGHVCTGNCSSCKENEDHKPCPLPCGRALLCSHRCHGHCSDSCSPCFRECRGWCPHGKCQGKCSEVCKPCAMPCAYTCPHQKCRNLCHEMCDREPCKKPCQKMLTCGHPCIGLCGESCPTLCYVCTPAQVAAVSPNKQRNKDLRFIQLKECGHVIEVKRMDAWMQQPLNTAPSEPAEPRRCPTCSVPIYFSFRYGNIVREALQNMFETDSFKLNTRAKIWRFTGGVRQVSSYPRWGVVRSAFR